MKKQKIMLLLEITLFIMIVGTIVSYAAGSNPPSDGVKYTNNGQTTVQGALNDLYSKIDNAGCNSWITRIPDTSQIAVGGNRTYYAGIYQNDFKVTCANKTCPTPESQGYLASIPHEILLPTSQKRYETISSSGTKNYKFTKDYDLVLVMVEQNSGGDTDKITVTGSGVNFNTIGSRIRPSTSSVRSMKIYQASNVVNGNQVNIQMNTAGKAIIIGLKGVRQASILQEQTGVSQTTLHNGYYTFSSNLKAALCIFNPSISTEGQFVHMSSTGLTNSSIVKLGDGKNFLGTLIKNPAIGDKIHLHLNDSGTAGAKCIKLQ